MCLRRRSSTFKSRKAATAARTRNGTFPNRHSHNNTQQALAPHLLQRGMQPALGSDVCCALFVITGSFGHVPTQQNVAIDGVVCCAQLVVVCFAKVQTVKTPRLSGRCTTDFGIFGWNSLLSLSSSPCDRRPGTQHNRFERLR